METWIVVILSILMLLLVVSTTFTAVMYKRNWDCRNNFSPVCYNDWSCYNENGQITNISRSAVNNVNSCTNGPSRECPCTWYNWYNPPDNVNANTCTIPT